MLGIKKDKKQPFPKVKISVSVFIIACISLLIWDVWFNDSDGSLTVEDPAVQVSSYLNDSTDDENKDAAKNHQEASPVMEELELNNEDDYFAVCRLSREQTRADELEVLQSMIDSGEDETAAAEKKLQIVDNMENELQAEAMLLAKDFGECVVMIADGMATVVVAQELSDLKASQIAEIVDSVSDIGYENVIIVNR